MAIEIYAKELSLEIVLKSIEIKEITKTIEKLPCINTSRYNLKKCVGKTKIDYLCIGKLLDLHR